MKQTILQNKMIEDKQEDEQTAKLGWWIEWRMVSWKKITITVGL